MKRETKLKQADQTLERLILEGGLAPAPALVLTLAGPLLTWSPRDPAATGWRVSVYDLSGHLLDESGSIDASNVSANINDQWDPPPFQISLQALGENDIPFGPVSNKVTCPA